MCVTFETIGKKWKKHKTCLCVCNCCLVWSDAHEFEIWFQMDTCLKNGWESYCCVWSLPHCFLNVSHKFCNHRNKQKMKASKPWNCITWQTFASWITWENGWTQLTPFNANFQKWKWPRQKIIPASSHWTLLQWKPGKFTQMGKNIMYMLVRKIFLIDVPFHPWMFFYLFYPQKIFITM